MDNGSIEDSEDRRACTGVKRLGTNLPILFRKYKTFISWLESKNVRSNLVHQVDTMIIKTIKKTNPACLF